MKCHSIDDEADGTKNIKWHPFEADDIKVHFTKFSHEPHISSVGDEGCVGCHQMKAAEGDYLKTYAGFDPSVFDSNFKQINKSVCANCHTPQVAGDTCTLCHDYHPIDLPPPVVQTQIGSRPKEDEGAAQSTTGG
jgi:hypothetical protein